MTARRILVACEFSGAVRDAFVARGFYARSVDLLPTESHGQAVMFRGDPCGIPATWRTSFPLTRGRVPRLARVGARAVLTRKQRQRKTMANDPAGTKAPDPAAPKAPAATDPNANAIAPPAAKTDTDNKTRSRGLHFLSAINQQDADKVGRMLRGADR